MSLLEQLKLKRARQEFPGLSLSQSRVGYQESLLFDAKDAAKIDVEALYLVAISGLNNLKKIDGRFRPFEATLFSPASKECNRSMYTKDKNEELNELIETFLALLAPYFLLKPAHKVLEYMIRKYCIHKYNGNELIRHFLPYHESLIFIRLLKIIPINEGMWNFFGICKSSGKCINRKELVNHIINDRKLFLTFLDHVKESFSKKTSYKILYGFYTIVILQIMEKEKNISENFIRTIWPYIVYGLSSRDEEYQIASSVIFCDLNWKVNISNDLVKSALDTFFVYSSPNLHINTITTTIALIQKASRKIDTFYPKFNPIIDEIWSLNSINLLFNWNNSSQILIHLNNEKKIDLRILINHLFFKLEHVNSNCNIEKFLLDIIGNFKDGIDMDAFIPILVVSLLKREDLALFDKVLGSLRLNHSVAFDRGIEIMMRDYPDQKRWFDFFEKTAYCQVKINDQWNTLKFYLKKFDDPFIKIKALERLLDIDCNELIQFKQEILLEHLKSKNVDLVSNVLELNELDRMIPSDSLFESLEDTLIYWQSLENSNIFSKILIRIFEKLIDFFIDNDQYRYRLQHWVISYLLSSNCDLRMSALGVSSKFDNLFLSNLNVLDYMNFENIVITISKNVSNKEFLIDKSFWWRLIDQKFTRWGVYLVVYNSMIMCDDLERFVLLMDLVWSSILVDYGKKEVQHFLSSVDGRGVQTFCDQFIALQVNYEKILTSFDDRSNFLFVFIYNIILKIKNFDIYKKKTIGADGGCDEFGFVYSIFKFLLLLLDGGDGAGVLLKCFFSIFGSSIELIVDFLTFIWVSPELLNDKGLVCRSLGIFRVLIKACDRDQQFLLNTIANLLVLLRNEEKAVSKMAFFCCKELHDLFSLLDFDTVQYKLVIRLIQDLKDPSIMSIDQYLVEFLDIEDVSNTLLIHLTESALKLPTFYGKYQLLDMLNNVRNSSVTISMTSRLLQSLLISNNTNYSHNQKNSIYNNKFIPITYEEKLINLLVGRWGEDVVEMMNGDEGLFLLFLECLNNMYESKENMWTIRRVVLERVNIEFYLKLIEEYRVVLFENLCDFVVCESSIVIRDFARRVMDMLPVESVVIVRELDECYEYMKCMDVGEPVRKKVKNADFRFRPRNAYLMGSNSCIDVLIVLLELLQKKYQLGIEFNVPFVRPLFMLLRNTFLTESPIITHPSFNYVQQLIFNNIISISKLIVDHLKDGQSTEGKWCQNQLKSLKPHYNIEFIIKNIGINENPTLHNNALLLLSNMALIYPKKVIKNIINIFSLIGTSVERSDDSYTFSIIEKILECIIPTLIDNHPKKTTISPTTLIDIFIQKLHSIPIHRSLILFTHLLKKILPIEYFSLVIILKLLYMNWELKEHDNTKVDFSFLLLLSYKISPRKCIAAFIYSIYWFMEVEEKIRYSSLSDPQCKINQIDHTTKLQLLSTFLELFHSYVTSKQLITQLIDKNHQIQKSLIALFQSLLALLNFQSKNLEITEKIYLIIDKIYNFINLDTFFTIIKSILNQDDKSLKNRILLIFKEKLTSIKNDIKIECEEESALLFLDFIIDLLNSNRYDDEEYMDILNQQIVFQSVQITSKLFGGVQIYKDRMLSILVHLNQILIDINRKNEFLISNCNYRLFNYHMKLKSSITISMGTLCFSMKEDVLGEINNVFPVLIETLEMGFASPFNKNVLLLQRSCLSSILLILQSIPLFLSGYLEGLLKLVVFNLSDKIHTIANELFEFIGQNIPIRLLLRPITSTFDQFWSCSNFDTLSVSRMKVIFKMMAKCCSLLEASDTKVYNGQIFNLFLKFFQLIEYILDKKNSIILENFAIIENVQEYIVEGFLEFLLKLNENQFNPLFEVMVEWAGVVKNVDTENGGEIWTPKLHLFYRLVLVIMNNLRAIFVPYFDSILRYTVEFTLQSANAMAKNRITFNEWQNHVLSRWTIPSDVSVAWVLQGYISIILNVLRYYFLYDTRNVFEDGKFEYSMPIIIDHFGSVGLIEYEMRMVDHLVPCVVQLAVYSGESRWKLLTREVLSKVHNSNSQVRNSVVLVLGELYRKLGESYLQFLPDLFQTLAFLLEDSDLEVANNTLTLIKLIEQLMGKEGHVMSLLTK